VARILTVDDSMMIRMLLREILSNGGHEIVGEASDGVQAEAMVRKLRPDLVTLDLVMPTRGGLDTLPYLLGIDPALPIVVCSASLDQHRVLAALRHGAVGFIVKPFDRESVLSNVHGALAQAAASASRPDVPPPLPSTGGLSPDEQREFVRVSAALPIRVTPDGARPLVTLTVDLSGSGVLLSSGQFAVGTPADFRLELGGGRAPIHGRARVARIDGTGLPALTFEQVSVDDHERLIDYIHSQTPSGEGRY
jgi:two-component system chemotaxis response regulator CheY